MNKELNNSNNIAPYRVGFPVDRFDRLAGFFTLFGAFNI